MLVMMMMSKKNYGTDNRNKDNHDKDDHGKESHKRYLKVEGRQRVPSGPGFTMKVMERIRSRTTSVLNCI